MKILHIMPYCPAPPYFGGALRIYHILKNLVQHHEVSVVMLGGLKNENNMVEAFGSQMKDLVIVPPPISVRMKRLGQFYALWTKRSFFHLLGSSREMQLALDRIFERERFDMIFIEFPRMAGYHFPNDAIKILDAHNIEYEIYRQLWMNSHTPLRRLHYHQEYNNLFRYEIEVSRKQDAIFVTSGSDKTIMDEHCPYVPKYVVPNGVDTGYFRPSGNGEEPHTLIFTGMMGYLPNYDGIEYFLDQIFPLIQRQIPDVKISIVGSSPPRTLLQRASGNIMVTGFVPDVRPYIERSSVYVVPLRMGSGTRLKILEAMAMKKPVVTTSAGCEGINIVQRHSAMVADDPVEFADAVVRLLLDASLRKQIALNGYELVHKHYDWSVIGEKIESIFQDMERSRQVGHEKLMARTST